MSEAQALLQSGSTGKAPEDLTENLERDFPSNASPSRQTSKRPQPLPFMESLSSVSMTLGMRISTYDDCARMCENDQAPADARLPRRHSGYQFWLEGRSTDPSLALQLPPPFTSPPSPPPLELLVLCFPFKFCCFSFFFYSA